MRSLSCRGLTLAELLIATTIVTIVFLGLGVASLSLRKMDAGFNRDTTLSLNLAAMAEDIRYAAMKAVGTKRSPGILLDDALYDMCFRIDVLPEEEVWRCYSRLPSLENSIFKTRLFSCGDPIPRGCTSADTYLGELSKDVFSTSGGHCPKPTFFLNPVTKNYSFRFRLITRENPLEDLTPSGCDQPLDRGTEDDPQEVLEYTVYPEAHSF